MATQKQLAALRKARAAKKRKTRGLAGITMPKTAGIMDTFKKAGLIVIGFVGGREVSRKFIKDDEQGLKRYLGSIVQLGGGILLTTQKNHALQYIGLGLAASGAVEAVSKVMNKDLLAEGVLNGLEGFSLGDILSGRQLPAYNVPFDFVPNLPAISESPVFDTPYMEIDDAGEIL
jgi:hypothetical protein